MSRTVSGNRNSVQTRFPYTFNPEVLCILSLFKLLEGPVTSDFNRLYYDTSL